MPRPVRLEEAHALALDVVRHDDERPLASVDEERSERPFDSIRVVTVNLDRVRLSDQWP